jgi:hypothetical protein
MVGATGLALLPCAFTYRAFAVIRLVEAYQEAGFKIVGDIR